MKTAEVLKRFPDDSKYSEEQEEGSPANPANHLYGVRFSKDQTIVEYLSEFLLVFSSAKDPSGSGKFSFSLSSKSENKSYYYPEDKLALKLFSFFLNSKLESRHDIHLREYANILTHLSTKISNNIDKEEALTLIQSLLSGFVGVPQGRTWTTHSFLPVSSSLLSREIMWNNTKANKELTSDDSWDSAQKYMDFDKHSFMARGGEVLFLQIANLKENKHLTENNEIFHNDKYLHIKILQNNLIKENTNLVSNFEQKLGSLLSNKKDSISNMVDFIEGNLTDWRYKTRKTPNIPKRAPLGWAPDRSRTEGILFVFEATNIINSKVGMIEKVELLQLLSSLQVLRSLCFQAVALDRNEAATDGFIGNYAWVPSSFNSRMRDDDSIVAQRSFEKIQSILFRILRHESLPTPVSKSKSPYNEAEKHSINLFRKLGKEIELIVPRTGAGERFSLNQTILRFFVAALISPGERIYLNTFYERLFAHYGIAVKGDQLASALKWLGDKNQGYYTDQYKNSWLEESLKQGGFLIELSDSVSMVRNPG